MDGHDNPSRGSVFDVWAVYDRNWRKPHYPSYMVRQEKVGSALDLEGAERIVRETVRFQAEAAFGGDRLHSLRIVEIPLGGYAPEWQTLSEYVYDHEGDRLDCRMIPYEDGIFTGRAPGEIRFREGDLCEVLTDNDVYLGFVVSLPPSVETASKRNRGPYHFDADDDSYIVLTDSDFSGHDHVDSLRVFRPRHRISPRTEKRLRDAYSDYISFPMRMKIADTAAAAQLQGLAGELGWTCRITMPKWKEDSFKLELEGVPGYQPVLTLEIPHQIAWKQMERIRTTFLRLAHRPAEGRGYRIKRIESLDTHPRRNDGPRYRL